MVVWHRSVADLSFEPRENVFPSPPEWRDQVFYHLLIDRFDDNDPESRPFTETSSGSAVAAANPRFVSGDDRRPAEVGTAFQGGNLRGITRRLDYIRGLGCTALWISPPFKNRIECPESYHGYGIQDFLTIDPRFGSVDDLRELVQEAHRRGMYVVIDIVLNHTGDNWAYADDRAEQFDEGKVYNFGFWRRAAPPTEASTDLLGSDDAVWPIELQSPDCYQRKGRIRDMGNASAEEARHGDFDSFKDFALEREDVLSALIRCFRWWIAQTDCDGYRIDTVKHTDPSPLALFCNAIREYGMLIGKTNFLIFGEVVGGDELLQKYIAQNTPVLGQEEVRYPRLDACLDFPLYFLLEEVVKGNRSPEALNDRYESFSRYFRDAGHAGEYYITFLDNHDQMQRPYKRFLHGCDHPELAILGIGYLLTSMGIPCIYYGTEQGFDGGGTDDSYVRENMFGGQWGPFGTRGFHFFNPDNPIYQGISRIAAIRRDQPVLRYGRQYMRPTSPDGVDFDWHLPSECTVAYCRILDNEVLCIAMNLTDSERTDFASVDDRFLPVGKRLVDLLEGGQFEVTATDGGSVCIQVPLRPFQMVILAAQN